MVNIAPMLGPFLARPPTPPRESSLKLAKETAFLDGVPTIAPSLDTPDESPASSAEYFRESSGKARKKVGFSGWTQYHQAGPVGSKSYDYDENRRRLPPSRECNPTKSILKSSLDISSAESRETLPAKSTSLPDMLRSASLHLSGGLRSSKIDAYNSLLGCLSRYENVPDLQELAEKVAEISVAIKRDITAKNADDTTDAQLAAQALKLLTVLLCTKGTSELIPEDVCSSVLEQSLICLEDPNSIKMLVSHHMHLLEKQRFPPRLLTTDRLNRLLPFLATITTRVKGNRVVCHRLNIYQRLLTQARPLMISRVENWFDNLVSGMLSSIKDVRARAIAFGMEAGLQLGTVFSISHECLNLLNRWSHEGIKVVHRLGSRLMDMTKTKEEGLHVPQIWSVVLLFLRSRPQQIERWDHLKSWLGIIQQCFNSSDAQIKFQANIAWNRFIFAIDINTSTSASLSKMLKQPIVSQLERKSVEKNARLAKHIARSSYCTMLYYALRPAASHTQLDQYWDLYVVEILPRSFSGSQSDLDYACHILVNLFFSNSQPKVWEANKANSTIPMKPDDLPALDSKWLRSKTQSILGIFDKLFMLAEWTEFRSSNVFLAWQSFMSALGNAGSKEVKVSMGTMTAIAKIVDSLKRFLSHSHHNSASSGDLKIFNILLDDAVVKIGHIPFNEKRLLLTQSSQYEAAAETPSSRGSSKSPSLDSATAILLELLLGIGDREDSMSLQSAIETVIRVTLQNASSRQNRLRALRNIGRLLSISSTAPQQVASKGLWLSLGKEMIIALRLPKTPDIHNDSPEPSGHGYRDVVKVLELGIHLHSEAVYQVWLELLDSLRAALDKDIGPIGMVLVVHEPLAEALDIEMRKQCDDMMVTCVGNLLGSVESPSNSKIVDHALVQLWGVKPIQQKISPMELLKPCQRLISTLLEATYASSLSTTERMISHAVSTATSTLRSLPQEYRWQFILGVQKSVGLWIEDAEGVTAHQSDASKKVRCIV